MGAIPISSGNDINWTSVINTGIQAGASVGAAAINANANQQVPYIPPLIQNTQNTSGNTGISPLDNLLKGAGKSVGDGTVEAYKPYIIGGAVLMLILIFKK